MIGAVVLTAVCAMWLHARRRADYAWLGTLPARALLKPQRDDQAMNATTRR